jgi:hypothetical protein
LPQGHRPSSAEWHVVDHRVIRHTWIEAAPAIDDRDRLLAADEIVRLESAEALIWRGDDDERGIDERGIDRFGDESLVAEGAAGAVRCEWVIANHSHACLRHGQGQGDALGFLYDVGERFIRQAQHPCSLSDLGQRRDLHGDAGGHRLAVAMIGDEKVAVCADMFAKEAEGDIVTRETRAPEAETTSEVLASDATVRTDGVGDNIHITARNPLAEVREGIGE